MACALQPVRSIISNQRASCATHSPWRPTLAGSAKRCAVRHSAACCAIDASHSSRGGELRQEEAGGVSRRALLESVLFASSLFAAQPAHASKLGAQADALWERVGGGPADLYFPPEFAGVWDVESTLIKIDLPMGVEFVPDIKVVARAQQEDMNRTISYQVAFIKNQEGKVILDRLLNTANIMTYYFGRDYKFAERVTWNPNDPNVLRVSMPGGTAVMTRVTRRSQENVAPDRINTSEYFEEVFDMPNRNSPRVKASQCFTKYKWRSRADAKDGGPVIVATQVVSDFLTSFDDERLYFQAMNKPVTTYTYRMAFRPAPPRKKPDWGYDRD